MTDEGSAIFLVCLGDKRWPRFPVGGCDVVKNERREKRSVSTDLLWHSREASARENAASVDSEFRQDGYSLRCIVRA